MPTNEPYIYIIHENESWVEPLFHFLKELNVPFYNWFINEGKLNLNDIPPQGIFYNRMSASSHTRNHRYAIELAESILSWLELHNRKVINDRRALSLEVRKAEQQIALNRFGIDTPKTIVVNNKVDLIKAAVELNIIPFIIKPNRGGKGTGVKLYNNIEQLKEELETNNAPTSLDGILLLQDYIRPVDNHLTRMEFIGSIFYYAVSVDTSDGFELCPADSCNIVDDFCPTSTVSTDDPTISKFRIITNYTNPDIQKYEHFLEATGIKIGALEYIIDRSGKRIVYDINTNTNYNSGAESILNNRYQGMRKIAEYLKEELYSI